MEKFLRLILTTDFVTDGNPAELAKFMEAKNAVVSILKEHGFDLVAMEDTVKNFRNKPELAIV